MSYNECLAAWHRMQRQQDRKEQAELNSQNALQNIKTKEKFFDKQANFITKLENLNKLAPLPFKPALNLISKIAQFGLNATKNIFAVYQNITQTINQLLNSISEKLSSFLGEIKNFVQGFKILSKTKKVIKTILSLFLNKNSEEEQEENEEVLRLKLREIKNSFLRIFILKEEQSTKAEENEYHRDIV